MTTVPWISVVSFAFLLIFLCYSATAQTSANLSTTWTINKDYFTSTRDPTPDRAQFEDILYPDIEGATSFACGFYCNGDCYSYLFAIHTVDYVPQVVWTANQDRLVENGAQLTFTAAGELVLQDIDGSKVWSSNTSGKSVVGMNLTGDGNLVLFDVDGKVVWQSFDHPTDTLLLGQKLFQGQKLIPSVSSTNWTSQQGMYSLQVTNGGLFAYVGSNPPQPYYSYIVPDEYKRKREKSYIELSTTNLSFFHFSDGPSVSYDLFMIPPKSGAVYMKLMPDGNLTVFRDQRVVVANLLTGSDIECGYPMVCGRNSLCSGSQQCSCLAPTYFKPVNDRQPNLGCSQITPLTCNATQDQDFIPLENVRSFTFRADMAKVNLSSCKQACLNNCSCKAVLFRPGLNSSSGFCHLPSEIYSMMNNDPNIIQSNASTFLKVQNIRKPTSSPSQPPSPSPKRKNRVATLLGSTIGGFLLLLLVIIGCIMFVVHKRKRNEEMEEDYLDQVSGLPTRFFYEELKAATDDFCKKLGQGGFGSVFEGTLEDGSKVAVKRLEGLVQTKKSFLAEVETIGNINHVNLVRLQGFCSLKSKLLLVYEFMSNGSLDRWIYHRDEEHVLNWECRRKIIVDIAKGLAYLHEDCRQRIIHLDIKPQNILLDSNFNAKIADFGLSKLVDRNQTQVMTIMRGTPGYMAPEWLSSIITEKVDIYSFGIVLLEILCGRKNFDRSEPEESWHLLRVFQNAWEQGKLLDIVDNSSSDMQAHGLEVVEMMDVVSWCLQTDFKRRPSMTSVVKVLEGVMEVESDLDYNFTDPRLPKTTVEREIDITKLLPSFLSGPR